MDKFFWQQNVFRLVVLVSRLDLRFILFNAVIKISSILLSECLTFQEDENQMEILAAGEGNQVPTQKRITTPYMTK